MITGLEGASGGGGPWTDVCVSGLNGGEEGQREEKKDDWSLLHTNTLADSHQRQALPLFRYRQLIFLLITFQDLRIPI